MPSGRLNWNNVAAPDFTGANQMFDRAAIMQNNAARMINQAFDDYRKDQSRVADNLVAGRMTAIQDLDAYKNALASGEFLQGTNGYVSSQMLNNLQNGVGTRLANAANLESLEIAKENRAWNQLERDTLIAASPYLQEINALANAGKYDEASRRIADLQKMAETNGWRYDAFGKYLPDVGTKKAEAQERALREAASRGALAEQMAKQEAIAFWDTVSKDPERFNAPLMRERYARQFNTLSPQARYFLMHGTTFAKDFGDWTSTGFSSTSANQVTDLLAESQKDAEANTQRMTEIDAETKKLTDNLTLNDQYYEGQIAGQRAIQSRLLEDNKSSGIDSTEVAVNRNRINIANEKIASLEKDRKAVNTPIEQQLASLKKEREKLDTENKAIQLLNSGSIEDVNTLVANMDHQNDAEIAASLNPLGMSLVTLNDEITKLPAGARDVPTYSRIIAQQHGHGNDEEFISDVTKYLREYTGKYGLSLPEAAALVSNGIDTQTGMSRYFNTNISADIGDRKFREPTEAAIKAIKNASKQIALAEKKKNSTAKVKELLVEAINTRDILLKGRQAYKNRFNLSDAEIDKRLQVQKDNYENALNRAKAELYKVRKNN